ncbi:hypothetical protein C482_11358 [Natrialba chahannaoensis JCM 10990]|uniref:Uncharacterized protein n=1 Tax=Natrialba chahannaoensis JCM 10990 TaxID=1227492 RepID=M0AKJ0_9EURY|nr:hypothetical protein [Natrialba chahannaoensis]ELY98871.1 hypothetical protein C482_11358 [Natrialba chahannaoensis JCM 10990]
MRDERTISVGTLDWERGQTTQDFVVGIGIFILAIAFVFSFLPSLITPFDSPAGGAETAQADRIADQVVANLSESQQANEIERTAFDSRYASADDSTLAERIGLRANADGHVYDNVNISIEVLNPQDAGSRYVDTDELAAGDTYDNQSAASASRIVTVVEEDGTDVSGCDPACRLVVRTW